MEKLKAVFSSSSSHSAAKRPGKHVAASSFENEEYADCFNPKYTDSKGERTGRGGGYFDIDREAAEERKRREEQEQMTLELEKKEEKSEYQRMLESRRKLKESSALMKDDVVDHQEAHGQSSLQGGFMRAAMGYHGDGDGDDLGSDDIEKKIEQYAESRYRNFMEAKEKGQVFAPTPAPTYSFMTAGDGGDYPFSIEQQEIIRERDLFRRFRKKERMEKRSFTGKASGGGEEKKGERTSKALDDERSHGNDMSRRMRVDAKTPRDGEGNNDGDDDDDDDDEYGNGDRDAEEEINAFIMGGGGGRLEEKLQDRSHHHNDDNDERNKAHHQHHRHHRGGSNYNHAEGRAKRRQQQRRQEDNVAPYSSGEKRKPQGARRDWKEDSGREHAHSNRRRRARGVEGSGKEGDGREDSNDAYHYRREEEKRRKGRRERRKHDDSSRHRSHNTRGRGGDENVARMNQRDTRSSRRPSASAQSYL